MKKRVAILISGGGSNMAALLDSMEEHDHPAEPVLVLSNLPGAPGIDKARRRGVATAVVDHRPFRADRAGFEEALQATLEGVAPDILCLAGFMRILTPDFIAAWEGRMLNVHPSLLPKYKGLHTHARALAAGDATAGCSVHVVTADLDGGPVLGQAPVSIQPGDTEESLAARVLAEEHRLYPAVLRQFARGELSPLSF